MSPSWNLITRMLAARRVVLDHAHKQYTPETCPAATEEDLDHYEVAQILTGLGCWAWTCPLCGQTFEE